MATCRVCTEPIERQGETDGATVANGDRPWVIVQPELDPETGTGPDIIDDGSHEHAPAASVAVIEYAGTGTWAECRYCRARPSYRVGRWFACPRHLVTVIDVAIDRQGSNVE